MSQLIAAMIYGLWAVRIMMRLRLKSTETEARVHIILTIINSEPRKLLYEYAQDSTFFEETQLKNRIARRVRCSTYKLVNESTRQLLTPSPLTPPPCTKYRVACDAV